MFVPPGYHINAAVENEGSSHKSQEQGESVYTYPAGIGSVMMNGCWGTGYKPGDPCYQSLGVLTACQVCYFTVCVYFYIFYFHT